MQNHLLNGLGWTLLFMASLIATSGSAWFADDVISIILTVLLAATSILLFWFGGYNRDRCKSRRTALDPETPNTESPNAR